MKDTIMRTEERIKELKREIDPAWARERRNAYIGDGMVRLFLELKWFHEWYLDATKRDVAYFIKAGMRSYFGWDEKVKRYKKLQKDFLYTLPEKYRKTTLNDAITDADIEQAREYPLERVVDVDKKGFALCPFHDDRRPSLYCRGGFYYCFSCEANGDVIDLAMKVWGLSFTDAVKRIKEE